MMTNLFSVFDPSSSFMSLNLNWTSSLIGIIFLHPKLWSTQSKAQLPLAMLFKTINNEFFMLLKSSKMNSIFLALMLFIMFNNLFGLAPYVFTSTSHLVTTLALALPLWLTIMLFGWITNTNHMLAHLVPQGTPPMLMMFMVCIETISNMIRPGTLAVRLTANMIAGHLLLTLLGNQGPNMTKMMMPMFLITQMLLLTLELAVALIQSYVFSILSTLYTSEIT